mmetsp:Transcript_94705/g.273849  ORF Transcript_94705/g.273849 Transcript_94705/m.273849 type:complete len:403 (-) Transcript_94705:419-1627(-)
MSAVASAFSLASATSSAFAVPCFSASATGQRTSTIVRMPGRAPPTFMSVATPSTKAGPSVSRVNAASSGMLPAIVVNMTDSRTPLEPPSPFKALPIAAKVFFGLAVLIFGSTSKMDSAPRFMVLPQSPSPTLPSSSLSSAAAATRTSQTFRMIASTAGSTAGAPWSASASFRGMGTSLGSQGATAAGQAREAVGARMRSAIPGPSCRMLTWMPFISRDVMSDAGPTRSFVDFKRLRMALVMRLISIGGTAPRLPTITASSAPASTVLSSRSHKMSAISFALPRFRFSKPGSPWMPRPTSISSSAMRSSPFSAPGNVQLLKDTPRERTLLATAAASASTLSKGRPAAAAAPAVFNTKSVPPRPRGCFASGIATSSLTMISFTSKPYSFFARAAAMPKQKRSPV